MTRDSGHSDPEARGPGWWQLVEEHLAALDHRGDGEEADGDPAPWSDTPTGAPALTDEQRALLAGHDQPRVPRLTRPEDDAPDDQPPVPRWRRHDHDDHDAPGSTTGNIPGDTSDDLS